MISNTTFSSSDKKNNLGAIALGGAVGLAGPSYVLRDTLSKVTLDDAKMMSNFMKKFMPEVDTFENTQKVAQSILKNTGLDKKGVKLNFIDNTSKKSLTTLRDIINTDTPQRNALNTRINKNTYRTLALGGNAGYFTKSKDVVVNNRSLYSSVYHELGHAMNANTNIFTKVLQKARLIAPLNISLVAPIALGVGLLHNIDDSKPKEEKGFLEKSADFIKKHAVAITAASYLPLVGEEGLASIRGLKQAKKYLPKETISKLGKNYLKAWGTYLAVPAIVCATVGVGIKLCDGIKNKRAQNIENSQQA